MEGWLQYPLIGLLMLTSLALMAANEWRRVMAILAVQYLVVFAITLTVWPLGMAAIKLVGGWMSLAILAARPPETRDFQINSSSRWGLAVRILALGLVWLVVFSISPLLAEATFIPQPMMIAGMLLVWGGLLQLGIFRQAIRVIIGLLTLLAGFEMIYAVVEFSLLVAGLLAAVNLGLAFIGSYLLTAAEMEEQP